ncbi:MAG: hypothetical protein R3327_02920 [Nitrosopumilaceae archaeon]|nr:hypothetical protein [Nitrosopumilaceae archaeon]
MWNLDFDDTYFRVYDSQKLIAGYFDPDYGEIFPKENEEEIISQMIKNHEKVSGGYLMVPLIKFGLFDTDLNINIDTLENKISAVSDRIKKWRDFITTTGNTTHYIGISHTDQDMLTITFPLKFSEPTKLEKKSLLAELEPTLNLLQKLNLL